MQQTENLTPHVQEIAKALGNKLDAHAIEDELRRYLEYGVPLAQAKRDIVRMHGGNLQVGQKRIADLQPEERGVDLKVKILTVNPKQITVKGQPKQIFYGFMADASGKTPYTSWKDLALERGANYVIKNAYVKKGFREGVDVQLGDYTNATRTNDVIDVKDDFAPNANSYDAGSRISAEHTVSELRDGMGSVTLTARILEAREKVISTANGQKTLVEGELADDTGRAPFSAWEPEKLPADFKENAVVRVKGAYVRAFRGVPSLNFGQYAQVEILPATALPDKAALLVEKPVTLGELESKGGGDGILVRGVIIDVKKGSGIIFRCGAPDANRGNEPCKRVLQAYECRVHGKNDAPSAKAGTPGRARAIADLRIKAVVDDGHGAATFFANREATERVLGKSLAQCEEAARDAMTTDVIQDELTEKLTARRVVLHGWARTDEFGLTINATSVEFGGAPDAAAEAEALLAKLNEAFPGVAQ